MFKKISAVFVVVVDKIRAAVYQTDSTWDNSRQFYCYSLGPFTVALLVVVDPSYRVAKRYEFDLGPISGDVLKQRLEAFYAEHLKHWLTHAPASELIRVIDKFFDMGVQRGANERRLALCYERAAKEALSLIRVRESKRAHG